MDGDGTPPDREPAGAGRPVLRVISGSATAEEVAAVLAVLAAAGAAPSDPQPAPRPGAGPPEVSTWAERHPARRGARPALTPSAHGWRTFYWPR